MKAVIVMFDTLNRRFLPAYGAERMSLPGFSRLQERAVVFDSCYGGSMPCMPARREMHTGRYNFLHRSWGPLEPFDDSAPEMLRRNGVYTHLVTDHQHYWEDGGATYHGRFSTFELFRGQEGDRWKGQVDDPLRPPTLSLRDDQRVRQDRINRSHMPDVESHSQTRTVEAGIEFMRTNSTADRWLLQIECFDPHEPFFSYPQHTARFPHTYAGPEYDWPDYKRVVETDEQVEHVRAEYSALLSMCDDSLGRVLDTMDELDLWQDTMLIVCTDHGLLLGEHGWWGKNVQPWYDENIHTPLFIWDPRFGRGGERRASLVQTIDFGPTLLDWFGIETTEDMQGHSLGPTILDDRPVRDAGLFGSFGGHVCVTDGRYVYMRACASPENRPLDEYTLMPTHMDSFFGTDELREAELSPPFSFTKSLHLLRVPGRAIGNPYAFGTLLFDLVDDPGQTSPMKDERIELRMARLLAEAMRANDAPAGQFERLGLPVAGEVTTEHLQIARQWEQIFHSAEQPAAESEFEERLLGVRTPLRDLLAADPRVPVLVEGALGLPAAGPVLDRFGSLSLWQLSLMLPSLHAEPLRELDDKLAQLGSDAEPAAIAGGLAVKP